MSISILIVDDEPLAREAVSLRLAQRRQYTVCGEAANGEDAVRLAKTLKPDVIFLDIEMPEMNGIEVARRLCALGPQKIIFVTAYDHFAVQAFQVNAIDYLLKPINDDQFAATLSRLADRINAHETITQNKQLVAALNLFYPGGMPDLPQVARKDRLPSNRIAVKDGAKTKLLNPIDIESVVSGKDYMCIKVQDTVLIHRCTMKKFIQLLPTTFLQCHRSHTVNMDYVAAIDYSESQMELVCKSGARHPVSRRFKSTVKKRLDQANLT